MRRVNEFFNFMTIHRTLPLALALRHARLRGACILSLCARDSQYRPRSALNQKADGYRGIWYMNEPVKSEYKYKYSGGLGTYCDYHSPFAVYRPEVNKTFFCYGGAGGR